MTQMWNRVFIDQASAVSPMLAALALITGVVILLLGWRLSRLVVTLDFAIFGLAVGVALTPDSDMRWLSACLGALTFGILSLWLDRYGEAIAGGLVAGLAAAAVMSWIGAPLLGTVLTIAATFGCSVALSVVLAKESVAAMTAVQGGLLAAFGLASCLACNGALWWQLREVLAGSNLALAMFMVAPMGIGLTFQLASIQNEEVLSH